MKWHPTALVDPAAELGAGVDVGPCAVIGPDTRIGDECRIGPHAVIYPGTSLGPRCRVHAGAVLGDRPQDLAFRDAPSRVEIGADCVIREHVTVHRGTKPGSATTVGDGCFLMAHSHLAHNCRLGAGVILANGTLLGGYVEIGDRAFLSGNVIVHQFVRIGRLAMIGGGAGLGKDVPPFCLAAGMRRNEIAGLNVIGLRRAGFPPAERARIRRAFELLYRSGLNVTQAVERLRAEFPDGPASEFAPFAASAARGLCPFGPDPDASGTG